MSGIQITGLTKAYREKGVPIPVLNEVTLSLEAGKLHALVGPSGCGKSTLLMLCGGLLQPDTGSIRLGDQDLVTMPAGARAELVGFVFQQFHLIPYLNIEQNMQASLLARPVANAKERCEALIERLGLGHRRGHLPAHLSSGEQQRVALGRALMNQPRVLIADEPTGNLDSENADHLLGLLREFADAGGVVLMATHDSTVAALADCIYGFQNADVVLTPHAEGVV